MENKIIAKFSTIEDYRCECNVKNKLVNILILIMCAVLCGIDDSKHMIVFIEYL